MDGSLALAYISALLKSLLENGLSGDPSIELVGEIAISLLAPDRIETGASEQARLNLFLLQVQANTSLLSHGISGELHDFKSPNSLPLVLDIYYLLSAYGSRELQPELLLGYATQRFHQASELTRLADVWQSRRGLKLRAPTTLGETSKNAVQRIQIRPQFLGTEELSKIWSALQARYRPSVIYRVTLEYPGVERQGTELERRS